MDGNKSEIFIKKYPRANIYKICDEAGLKDCMVDEDFAREHGFTGDSIDLISFASDREWQRKRNPIILCFKLNASLWHRQEIFLQNILNL